MNEPREHVNDWTQMPLFGASAFEITLRIGCIPDAGHAQFQIEAHSAMTGELLAMTSRHHSDFVDVEADLLQWAESVRIMIGKMAEPF